MKYGFLWGRLTGEVSWGWMDWREEGCLGHFPRQSARLSWMEEILLGRGTAPFCRADATQSCPAVVGAPGGRRRQTRAAPPGDAFPGNNSDVETDAVWAEVVLHAQVFLHPIISRQAKAKPQQ